MLFSLFGKKSKLSNNTFLISQYCVANYTERLPFFNSNIYTHTCITLLIEKLPHYWSPLITQDTSPTYTNSSLVLLSHINPGYQIVYCDITYNSCMDINTIKTVIQLVRLFTSTDTSPTSNTTGSTQSYQRRVPDSRL